MFLENLLSQDTGFSNGAHCDILQEVPEEIAKLKVDTFDYESDSDLEDDRTVDKGKRKEGEAVPCEEEPSDSSSLGLGQKSTGDPTANGRAFAINGTAYKTWKTFLYYLYTNEVAFNELRSQQAQTKAQQYKSELEDDDSIRCSPKSMYRLADYVGIPGLKALALDGIWDGLHKSNIIAELFSSFTHRYQEVIELEVDYLMDNFTPQVARQLDDMLQMIVLGTKPHSFRVLAFAMRRLRGDSRELA